MNEPSRVTGTSVCMDIPRFGCRCALSLPMLAAAAPGEPDWPIGSNATDGQPARVTSAFFSATLGMVTERTVLADFLRARRALVSPEEVGLTTGPRRRVAGLRREEVAVLAGISTEYYVRLEQGHEHRPSAEVLDGIGKALRLNDDAVTYMQSLAAGRLTERNDSCTRRLDPAIDVLIERWPVAAAHVHDRSLTVVAANGLARALSPQYDVGSRSEEHTSELQ